VSRIQSHEELEVYGLAFEAAMQIFELSKGFPREEVYSLTDQILRVLRALEVSCLHSPRVPILEFRISNPIHLESLFNLEFRI